MHSGRVHGGRASVGAAGIGTGHGTGLPNRTEATTSRMAREDAETSATMIFMRLSCWWVVMSLFHFRTDQEPVEAFYGLGGGGLSQCCRLRREDVLWGEWRRRAVRTPPLGRGGGQDGRRRVEALESEPEAERQLPQCNRGDRDRVQHCDLLLEAKD